jgi:hypothetical protein
VSDQNFSAIRARLRYETIEDFVDGYARFISAGGMFIPMKPGKLKPIGTTIRFQFLLGDGSTALLGEGIVLQVRAPDDASPQSPVGMLIKFSKLAQESKALVDRIVEEKTGGAPAPEDRRDDIHNDRTPLPQDKESYERKTREFENRTLNQLLESEPAAAADAHSKRTDSGAESAEWRDITREQRVIRDAEHADEESGTPVNDAFESDEEANDALVAAALAMASEVSEDSEPEETSDADDSVSLEEIDPETAEAPEVAEPETREAPEMLPEVIQEALLKSPTQLGETAGGLKILAFDENMDEMALKAMEEFSFGAEEADIDHMFDGLFGDGGGGFFGGESDPEPQPSMEFEVPGLTQEVSDELVEEEILVADEEQHSAAEEESPVEENPVFSLEDLMDDEDEPEHHEPSPVVVEEESEVHDEVLEEESAPEFSLSEALEESEPELRLDSRSEPEPEFDAPAELSLGSSDASSNPDPEFEDIGSLLDNLDDSSRMLPESMHLGTSRREASAANTESEVEDEESLEALLASARREMEGRSTEEPRDSGDILDQLLGDDLPPPPGEGPVFGMPQPDKKKKGFLSKFFDKG